MEPSKERVHAAEIPNADEHLVKAQLVFKIDTLMKERGLKQIEAADLFGIKQPDVSKMLRGEFRQFSVERLLRFLVALNSGCGNRRQGTPWQKESSGTTCVVSAKVIGLRRLIPKCLPTSRQPLDNIPARKHLFAHFPPRTLGYHCLPVPQIERIRAALLEGKLREVLVEMLDVIDPIVLDCVRQ